MKSKPLLLMLIALMSALVACSESGAQSAIPDLPYVELAKGEYTQNGLPTRKQTKIISSQSEYAAELANYTSAAAATVDFAQGKVLLIDMGSRDTGGYSVSLTRAYDAGEWVQTAITLVLPGAGCAVSQAATNPYQFVFIPSQKEILISESLRKTAC